MIPNCTVHYNLQNTFHNHWVKFPVISRKDWSVRSVCADWCISAGCQATIFSLSLSSFLSSQNNLHFACNLRTIEILYVTIRKLLGPSPCTSRPEVSDAKMTDVLLQPSSQPYQTSEAGSQRVWEAAAARSGKAIQLSSVQLRLAQTWEV